MTAGFVDMRLAHPCEFGRRNRLPYRAAVDPFTNPAYRESEQTVLAHSVQPNGNTDGTDRRLSNSSSELPDVQALANLY